MDSYKHWIGPALGDLYWMDIVHAPFVIANTLNLYVVVLAKKWSTMFLPIYSEKDLTDNMIIIGYFEDQKHFVAVSYLIILLMSYYIEGTSFPF